MDAKEAITFYTTYKSKKDSLHEFEIKPLSCEKVEEIAKIVAHICSTTDPVVNTLGFTQEELYLLLVGIAEINIEQHIGISCFEKRSGEFAAILLTEDLFYMKNPNKILEVTQRLPHLHDRLDKALAIVKRCMKAVPKAYKKAEFPLQKLRIEVAVTHPKYQGLGLMTRMVHFLLHEHPYLKFAESVVTEATNPGTQTVFERNGFKSHYELSYKSFEYKGERVLEAVEQKTKEKGFKPAKKLKVMILEKNPQEP